ncbi:MAG: Smr/MutS family protein [Alphaproteobacteria bacterium]|nr:Smr/MutS family protein [Alphaproteobacteria bacterium]
MSGRRPVTRSELDLWRRWTADVQPLADVPPDEKLPKHAPKQKLAKKTAPPKVAHVANANVEKPALPRALDPKGPVDIDRRSWERLKRGQIRIERKLDLHGQTQPEAHGALNRFLQMASATGLRCVLVVTGKGGVDGRGVLRQMVPRWLGEAGNRDKVLTYAPAQPRHGGDGALYVLLRRRRNG